MSKKVSLSSPLSKKKLKESNSVSVGTGECEFPFIYKGVEYKECIKNKKGELICATERYPSKKLKKYAYCVDTPKKNNRSKKTKLKVSPKFNPKTINNHLLIPNNKSILPSNWELPNRQTYPSWFAKSYIKYKASKGSFGSSKKGVFDFFIHQKLIKDYLNADSPYRGLLLYHGLGVGKTCASIAISECFRNNRNIVVLLNKSLVKNFKDNLMKCGYELFRTNQYWEFHTITDSKDPMMVYAKTLGIPKSLITKNNGAWFIDFSKSSNYDSLNFKQQTSLNNQIETMINSKYTFKHIDGLTRADLDKMNETKFFDNKLVIVDEVHNITNAMSKASPGIRGSGLKKLIMNATNLKLVFLSGTPIINNLFESAQLFNLLRGYIINFQFTLTEKTGTKSSFNKIVDELKKNNLIDQIIPKKSDNIINIVRNPTGFVSSKDGVIRSEDNNITDSEFVSKMKSIFSLFNYNVSVVTNKYTALPDNELEFMNLFYNESKNQVKNPLLLQSRILGLVSYFRTQGKGLLPTVTKNEVISIPMSNYQFLAYSLVRKAEIDQDKSKKGSKSKSKGSAPKKSNSIKSESGDNLFEDKSSYRAYSRMHCSFVFPESVPRPSKKDAIKVDVKEQIDDFNALLKKYKVDTSLTTQLKGLKIDNEIEGLTAQLTIINKALEDESQFETYTALENVKTELEELIEHNKIEQIHIDIEDDKGDELDVSPVIKKKVDKSYEKAKVKALKKLDEEKNNLFKINDPEQLEKYSPKYNHIIKMCNSINGLSFIYTEYKTLEGIAILKIALKANGYAEFKLKESARGNYEINIDKTDIGKPMFAFWGGDVGMSDIIRRVYNNQFDELPVNIKGQLEKLYPSKNNIRGDIIKILMTTKSGAEGIDLQNVRQVHIVEPYWNPVRTEQVKGRAVRVGSHLQLPEKDRTVEIFTYLSVIKKEDLDSDITIKDDKNGMSSDEVLFEISQKKLEVMNHFLTLIKEASVDCNININETRSKDNYFECVKYGSKVTRNDYSFIPNIQREHNDAERKRRVQTTQSEYDFKLLPINGKKISFAVRIDNSVGEHIALYDSQKIDLGEMHEPLAEFNDKTKKLTLLNKKLFKKYISQ